MVIAREVTRLIPPDPNSPTQVPVTTPPSLPSPAYPQNVVQASTQRVSAPSLSPVTPLVAQKPTLSHHAVPQSAPPIPQKAEFPSDHRLSMPAALSCNELLKTSRVSV